PCEECGERLHEACAERMLAGLMHPECRKAYLARLAKEDPEGAVAEYRFLAERLERQAGVYRANFAVVRAVLAEDIKDRYGYAAKLGAIACIANLPLCPADMAQILTLLHKRAEAA
ncbi:MAG: hypothetical protein LLG20_25500, partial [Acidobacteriales bacterium]|nr:hypothetical protein [Terriglobales bacterium]